MKNFDIAFEPSPGVRCVAEATFTIESYPSSFPWLSPAGDRIYATVTHYAEKREPPPMDPAPVGQAETK